MAVWNTRCESAVNPVTAAATREIAIPYDGTPVATVYEASKEHVEAAVAAAVTAAPLMRELTLDERASILRRAYQKTLDRRDDLA